MIAAPARRPLYALCIMGLLAFALACGPGGHDRNGDSATRSGTKVGKAIKGKASWYGGRFHGRKTASGERFNKNALTAAHRKLPFGTKVRVTHEGNGKSVIVRINDRGPFGRLERIIDLSEAAAERIGMKSSGVARIRLEVLRMGDGKRR